MGVSKGVLILAVAITVLAAVCNVHGNETSSELHKILQREGNVTQNQGSVNYGRRPYRSRGSVRYNASRRIAENAVTEESLKRSIQSDSTTRRRDNFGVQTFSEPSPFKRDDPWNHVSKSNSATTSTTKAPEKMDFNQTVLEVENYFKSHPELPVISHEEIVDYIHNVSDMRTNSELNGTEIVEVTPYTKTTTSSSAPEKNSNDKPVMVVLPFQANNETEMEELFTKSPLVRMIDADEAAGLTEFKTKSLPEDNTTNPPTTESTLSLMAKIYGYPVYKPTITEEYSTTTDPSTVRSYTNYNDAEMVTKRYHFEESKRLENASQPYNHRLDEDVTDPFVERLNGAIVVLPLKNHNYYLESRNINASKDAEIEVEKAQQETYPTTDQVTVQYEVTTKKPFKSNPRKRTKTTTEKSWKVELNKFQQTDSLEEFSFEPLQVDDSDLEKVTSTTEEVQKITKSRKNQRRKPKTTTTTTTSATTAAATTTDGPPRPEDLTKIMEILPPNMKDLLQNLGLNEEKKPATTEEPVKIKHDSKQIQPSIDPSSYSAFKPLPLARYRKNEEVVDEDMKELLASYGLLNEDYSKIHRQQKSMEPAKEKQSTEEIPNVNVEIVPQEMRPVLHNLGFTTEPRAKQSQNHIFNPSNHSTFNRSQGESEKLQALVSTFKTIANQNDTKKISPELRERIVEQIQELVQIIAKYKTKQSVQLQKEIEQIINKNKERFPSNTGRGGTKDEKERHTLEGGPDPKSFNDTQELKNEVKRQISSSSSSSSSSGTSSSGSGSSSSASASSSGTSINNATAESSSSADSSETTTQESPNIEGLKESFGGGETASDEADIESALPPKKPNGLYLLVDWNSFLEVGTDDDKRRVNIRFQPKVGDGRHFIPVTIP